MNRKFGRAKHVTTENAVVVVTRPAPDHSRLIRSLGEIGRAAIHNPGFRFESEPAERLQRRLKELADFDLAIVTSPMAARLIAAHSTPAMIGNVRFIAPGRGTASILEAAGLPAAWPEVGGTSEHILAMPVLESMVPGRIAIVGAPGGRTLLAREFSRRGSEVVAIHLYRRIAVPPNPALLEALGSGADLVVLISSRQAFETILEGLPHELRESWLASSFVVSSARMANLCRDAGARRISIAAGAADQPMLSAAL
ncbi:MAG: uroporphyrinogen-III synthase, partial [Wenzhouxiangellaceae bacterium]|nr:uroporphyrinogen-III synthase [Wenzhouxiangellaceae bacterium]